MLFNQELHEVALGQVELSLQQCKRIEGLAGVGKASSAEVADAKARVAQDRMTAVQTENDYRLALLTLSQLIELESPEGFVLESPSTAIAPSPITPPDDIYQTALTGKASIQAAQYRLEGSKRSVRMNYALQLDNAKKTLYKEIQQAWYNATAAESKYTSSHAAALASEESFRLMTQKFENGKANAVEFNEAKQNLMKAQSDELQAKYDYLFRTKILDFYKGVPIE